MAAGPQDANRKLHLLWIGCGNQGSLFPAAKSFSEFLTEQKIKHTFRESSGAHYDYGRTNANAVELVFGVAF